MAGTHHCHAHFAHDGFHVGEVDVDHARTHDQISDTLYRAQQHVVGLAEGCQQASVFAKHGQQLFVRDGDQRVNVLAQFTDTFFGHLQTLAAFERERLGHDGDGEDTHFTGDFCNDRRRTGTGTTTHACGDEYHVRALQHLGNALAVFNRSLTADQRVGTGTQTFGDTRTQLQHGTRADVFQCLGIGVGADEINTFHIVHHHVLQRVAAATAHTDDLDYCVLRNVIDQFEHGLSP